MLRILSLLVVAITSLIGSGIAESGIIMTPPGLVAGNKFRILFVTSTIHDATSTNIADYDSFVTSAAAVGTKTSLTYNGDAVFWKAIASTSSFLISSVSGQPTKLPNTFEF